MKKIKTYAIILAVVTIVFAILAGCVKKSNGQKYFSMDDLQGPGKVFSLWISCGYEEYVEKFFPEAGMVFGDYVADLALNVKQGKADAMIIIEPCYNYFTEELSGMAVLPGDLGTIDVAVIFSSAPKGDALRMKFNTWLANAKATGTLEALEKEWCETDKSNQAIDYSLLDPNAEHILVGFAPDEPPYTFTKDGIFMGRDVEMIVQFCIDCGYYPEITGGDYNALVVDTQQGKFDLVAAGYELTEERAESVSFSDATEKTRVIVAVQGDVENVNFFDSIKNSFKRTFIDDNRAMQFLKGIGITLLITVFSVAFGTLLGFGLYLLNRDGGKVVQKIIEIISLLLQRIPSVVLLMVFYYLIFGSININATIVAIILFTIRFCFSTFETLTLAIDSVGKGQTEAAFTLGLTQNETLFKILLKQGMPIFMSGFKDNIVSILLESAVVGYVSVMDLTRVGDIIRNNTYEAFFPLIVVAIFYLLLSSIIIGAIEKYEQKVNPKNRTHEQILKNAMNAGKNNN